MWHVEFSHLTRMEGLTTLLRAAEAYFSMRYGWERSSFGVYAEMFSDSTVVFRLDPPTDLDNASAHEAELNEFINQILSDDEWL